ncbi:MAG: DUF4010 domain-containing protein [Planctomycetia bacterium]|nr:DUF4010 domain-containing protein [Planctomycetia bacterium]
MNESLQLMDAKELLFQLGLSLILGLLVGLQRERSKEYFGIRTFSLITIFGTLSAFLATQFGFWVLPAGYLCLTLTGISAFVFPVIINKIKGTNKENQSNDVSYGSDLIQNRKSDADNSSQRINESNGQRQAQPFLNQQNNYDFGTTTLITSLVMYSVGAMLANPDWTLLALEVGGITAILLQFKLQLHQIAERLGENDMKAIMQFVMLSFIILPILPNKDYGPFHSFNPFETWLMVVLIVGMSLGGYIVYKFFGENAGILLGGFLGGAISSTATTICYSKMARDKTTTDRIAAVVILISSAVQPLRILIIVSVISSAFLATCFLPLFLFMIVSFFPVLILWSTVPKNQFVMPEQSNPTQWKSALTFGLLYAIVLFLMNAAKAEAHNTGLYCVSGISGLVDMNAVALSTARLSLDNLDILKNGWRYLIIGAMANLFFKWIIVLFIAGRSLALTLFSLLIIPMTFGGFLLFWFS